MSRLVRIRAEDVAAQAAEARRSQELVSAARGGAEGVTLRLVELEPLGEAGTRTPHRHRFEEVIHILEGEGQAWVEGEREPIAAGDTLLIPTGLWHALLNTGSRPMRVLCFFPDPAIDRTREIDEATRIPARGQG